MESGEDVGAGVGRDVEDGIDHEWEEGEGDLAGEKPEECHSEILNIFISSQRQRSTLLATSTPLASTECFVDDNAVGSCCGHEGGAIREAGPARVEVEGDVGEAVAERAEEERDVADKPAELKGLG